jgi:hypothetical protein
VPNVAVLHPSAVAAPSGPSTVGLEGSTTAPIASASATASRWASDVMLLRP